MPGISDPSGAGFVGNLRTPQGTCRYVDLRRALGHALSRLPWCLRVLLENVLRCGEAEEADAALAAFRAWIEDGTSEAEIAFRPGRVLMHDTTCTPALVDIAAMRDVLVESGGDPTRLNPVCPVHAVIDHSVAVDRYGAPDALEHNMRREIERNGERYRFMKWAAGSLANFHLFPPGTGILHTINLEHLAAIVAVERRDGVDWAVPDTLIGTDSHTPMVNALGVLAWGVGGLEAESAIFGMPVVLRLPEVVGARLTCAPRPGMLATDLALAVTERLRRLDVVDSFVEFFGPGLDALGIGERAAVANMAPEYGATTGFFPVDRHSLNHLRRCGRDADHVALVAAYAEAQGLWRGPGAAPRYTRSIEIDLATIAPAMAGPRRPQDRVPLDGIPAALAPLLAARGRALSEARGAATPGDGAVALAAITSCTNTADPRLLVAAGLVARRARALGLRPPTWVKTSLAPGSGVAARYLGRAGLLADLAALGFDIVGYGCTTCIGNAGPLAPAMAEAIERGSLLPVAVLSGNRNFPGRIHPQIDAAFLASPPLVVAYALAGHVGFDATREPLASANGRPVHLADLWPSDAEIADALAAALDPADVPEYYRGFEASAAWHALAAPEGPLYPWDQRSTYLRRPPFVARAAQERAPLLRAHPLLVLGDDVTTDHISPAGAIPPAGAAGRHLAAAGEDPGDLNVFAARRGNFEVMLRGLFTNRALRNRLCPEAPPGHTVHAPTGEILPLPEAAARYAAEDAPVVIVAGHRYGAGSSRDWAAKGPSLLGVRAVLACSFERIHRANLVGMGILPIQLPEAAHPDVLGLDARDRIEIGLDDASLAPRRRLTLRVLRACGRSSVIEATLLVNTRQEVAMLRHGGIIPLMLERTLAASPLLS